ncbi:MAG: sigma-54 dependent transcriptional regulator [Syntrophobacteraceae bacterium]|nr:sigma-54 dependent transcriptional regulator [Syntrophobacteraceae bacterium]
MAGVLIIDDDEEMCYALSRMVGRLGHTPVCANSISGGLEEVRSGHIDVVFLDVRMPDGNGLEALPRIQSSPSSPEVIIITGFGDADGAEIAIKSGAWDYIEKGCSTREMSLPLLRALEYRKQKQSAREGAKSIVALKRGGIIGSSSKLMDCLDFLAQAAASETSVLITGETGTGKELFARAIHSNSSRAKGPFVVVDCAALPETLVESVLFGHEKGAYTGAEKASEGLVGQAGLGTLFLDEVGELPPGTQKSFLRVLQEHRFRPVGSKKELGSDFRLVAATNRNMDKMAQEGHFRDDLLFRLKSFVIELPPLRERSEDIRELARHHIDRFCEKYGLTPKGFSPEFLEILKAHQWPGNIRELVNTLDRALAAARFESTLFPKHLPVDIRVQRARASVNHKVVLDEGLNRQAHQALPSLQEFREAASIQAEKNYLTELIGLCEGDIKEACRISGVSQSRLYALLQKHKISR